MLNFSLEKLREDLIPRNESIRTGGVGNERDVHRNECFHIPGAVSFQESRLAHHAGLLTATPYLSVWIITARAVGQTNGSDRTLKGHIAKSLRGSRDLSLVLSVAFNCCSCSNFGLKCISSGSCILQVHKHTELNFRGQIPRGKSLAMAQESLLLWRIRYFS